MRPVDRQDKNASLRPKPLPFGLVRLVNLRNFRVEPFVRFQLLTDKSFDCRNHINVEAVRGSAVSHSPFTKGGTLFADCQGIYDFMENDLSKREKIMYGWALFFFIFSSLAAICGFADISAVPASTARLFFYIFLAAAVVTAEAGMLSRRKFPVGHLIVDIKE